MLKIRSIVINETVTAEMKKFVAEKMDQVYDEIQARKLEELPKVASDIAIVIERERSDLLERFLKLSCETDTETLRFDYNEISLLCLKGSLDRTNTNTKSKTSSSTPEKDDRGGLETCTR